MRKDYTVDFKKNKKIFLSPNYNYIFDMKNGKFSRWGRNFKDDPLYSPYGPELLDIEISSGFCKGKCPWCYKGNGTAEDAKYMTFEEYKILLDSVYTDPLTQIAFGITDVDANPDMWKIFEYTRSMDIIPNYTTNGIGVNAEVATKTKNLCGAVAVSVYPHTKEIAYNAIDTYSFSGMSQVNIHFMLSAETLDFAYEVLKDIQEDPRLCKLNAIVFLQYKDKNPEAKFHNPNFQQFKMLVDFCLERRISFGFDSCSSAMFMKAVANRPEAVQLIQSVDNCESSLMSFYINVEGYAFPCSFLEGIGDWKEGIDCTKVQDFIEDVWYSDKVIQYRNRLLESSKSCNCKYSGQCRSCFMYEVNDCKKEV